jgi:hypothetical protein
VIRRKPKSFKKTHLNVAPEKGRNKGRNAAGQGDHGINNKYFKRTTQSLEVGPWSNACRIAKK